MAYRNSLLAGIHPQLFGTETLSTLLGPVDPTSLPDIQTDIWGLSETAARTPLRISWTFGRTNVHISVGFTRASGSTLRIITGPPSLTSMLASAARLRRAVLDSSRCIRSFRR